MLDIIIKLLLSLFLVSSFQPAQNNDVTTSSSDDVALNSLDSNGRKVGKWKYYGKDLPEYQYDADKLVLEGNYKIGKKEGEWIHYFKDGRTPLLIANYKENRPFGAYKKFNKKGILIESGDIKDGKYDGIVSMYYENGTPKYKGEFYKGHENGDVVQYDRYGNILLSYTSFNNVINEQSINNATKNKEKLNQQRSTPQTNVTIPQNTGRTAPVITNPNVKGDAFDPNGYNKIYNDQNDILQDGTFKSGKLFDGKLYQYDNDGILFKVKIYRNGVYVSDGQI